MTDELLIGLKLFMSVMPPDLWAGTVMADLQSLKEHLSHFHAADVSW